MKNEYKRKMSKQETFTGVFRSRTGKGCWIDADGGGGHDIFVRTGNNNGAVNGQRVEFQVIEQRFKKGAYDAKVVSVSTDVDAFYAEKLILPEKHKLPGEYNPKGKWRGSLPPEPVADGERRDSTDVLCVTIDPDDAKDYDDAVSLVKKGKYWELGVYIADVSYYVPKGSQLDKEAQRRGSSTYLPWGVIPMLPPLLSENLCSLRENELRPAAACVMKIDADGKVVSDEVFRCLIKSRKRLTYAVAQNLIDGKEESDVPGLSKMLKEMDAVALKIKERRFENGSLDFDLPEIKIQFDKEGLPVGVKPYEKRRTNGMIEEFMLLANQAVARRLIATEMPSIYRIHTPPEGEGFDNLCRFAKSLGVKPPVDGTLAALRSFMDSVKGTAYEKSIQTMTLRSMTRARYSSNNDGHFGLAFDAYTHFTSPIRRYPDLLVHRLLFAPKGTKLFAKDEMERLATQSSENEERSTKAERDAISLSACTAMRGKVGEIFEGNISGIIEAGIFVELKDMGVDGMVHVSKLGEGYFWFDPNTVSMVSRENRKRFRIGDPIRVKITEVCIPLRRVDLLPV
ncbi:MAG: VacB/RNase II family 3'-5' exoribonuclease [Fibrobacteres bacterium]|nr:VacB/RNase II family 3'-5' exoribonuclease [Fibrobacterota bacterium]